MTSTKVPKVQKAAVKVGKGEASKAPAKEVEVQSPEPHQLLVKLNWTGLCASDNALLHDGWAFGGVAMTPETRGIAGHEGAGTVVAVGDKMHHKWKVGDRAGIKWVASVCGECEFCTNGVDELHCPNQKDSAVNVPGTFQQYAIADGNYTTRIPDGVKDEEAGPIMCGGLTTYVGCKRSGVKPGQWIAIAGAGGGLGHFAVQYAKAMGMRVIAIDTGSEKRELCKKIGAEEFVDFAKTSDLKAEILRVTTYGAHSVLVTAYTKEAFDSALPLLRPGGALVVVGIAHDPKIFVGGQPLTLCLNKLNIAGTVTGTLKEAEECLDFTARGLVHPVLTKGTIDEVDKYCELLDAGKVAGRVVLKL